MCSEAAAHGLDDPVPAAGQGWGSEGHGVAGVVRTERLVVEAQTQAKLTSLQDRCLLTVRLRPKGTCMSLLVGTAHLESGAGGAEARPAIGLKEEVRLAGVEAPSPHKVLPS